MDQQYHHSGQVPDPGQPEDSLVRQHTTEIPVVSVVDGRRPAPFVPDFSWRPGMHDYPVPLIESATAIRRRAGAGGAAWSDMPTLDDVGKHRSPARYIPHALAVAAVVAAVTSNGFWLDRITGSSDQPENTPVAVVSESVDDGTSDNDSDRGESLLDRSQQPGQGGLLSDETATPETGGDGEAEESAPAQATVPATPEPRSTQAPQIPNPNVPSATTTVAVPEAGVVEYVVSEGETLHDVAAIYGLSVTSLLWPNGVADPGALLDEGSELLIPPVDGVLHTVARGETIDSIATRYGVETTAITGFEPNAIGGSPSLTIGQHLMVPGGVIYDWGQILEYTVRDGDNLWIIADYYGLDPQSIAWANTLPRPELISVGQVLEIPPGDGALITVEAGDHVEAVAERFGVDPAAIRGYAFNNLADGQVLQQGQKLLVPGAPLPDLESEEPEELDAETVAGEGALTPATGTFIWPTNGFVSQEFHGNHNGLDVANEEWTPVNAADGGVVIFAGWNDYGLGYAVGIDHGNGYQTWYGHLLNQPYVEVGQVIWQGGYLGPMGSTGKSTGPHLHFIVMKDGVYQNPMNYLQR